MNTDQLDRLADIIYSKSWSAFDYQAHPRKTIFNAIVDMLTNLPFYEVDLTLDLLDDYTIIRDYGNAARQLMVKIKERAGKHSVIVTPIVDYDAERAKSGQALTYEMNNFTHLFERNQIVILDDPMSDRCQQHSGLHYCVDDFIGTGNQFLKMRETVQSNGKIFNVTDVGALYIQQKAKETLQREGFRVTGLNVKGKAIELLAARRGVALPELYAEYDTLEKKTKCPEKYSLGRDQTEALITMKSTPNNTLPIFWIEGSHGWPAPFPRPRR